MWEGGEVGQGLAYTVLHLSGSLLREGQGQNVLRFEPRGVLEQMDNTLRDDSGLAASRARNDEQRSFAVFNRPELFRIELQHESNQVTSRESKVESGLTGKVGVKFPRFQPKKSVPSCGPPPY